MIFCSSKISIPHNWLTEIWKQEKKIRVQNWATSSKWNVTFVSTPHSLLRLPQLPSLFPIIYCCNLWFCVEKIVLIKKRIINMKRIHLTVFWLKPNLMHLSYVEKCAIIPTTLTPLLLPNTKRSAERLPKPKHVTLPHGPYHHTVLKKYPVSPSPFPTVTTKKEE